MNKCPVINRTVVRLTQLKRAKICCAPLSTIGCYDDEIFMEINELKIAVSNVTMNPKNKNGRTNDEIYHSVSKQEAHQISLKLWKFFGQSFI